MLSDSPVAHRLWMWTCTLARGNGWQRTLPCVVGLLWQLAARYMPAQASCHPPRPSRRGYQMVTSMLLWSIVRTALLPSRNRVQRPSRGNEAWQAWLGYLDMLHEAPSKLTGSQISGRVWTNCVRVDTSENSPT